jgi:hypothetical protein
MARLAGVRRSAGRVPRAAKGSLPRPDPTEGGCREERGVRRVLRRFIKNGRFARENVPCFARNVELLRVSRQTYLPGGVDGEVLGFKVFVDADAAAFTSEA